MPQQSIEIEVKNKGGIHARPSAKIAQISSKYKSDIFVQKGNIKVSAKSIMSLMTLEAQFGTIITITADGEDSQQALDDLKRLIEKKFYFNEEG